MGLRPPPYVGGYDFSDTRSNINVRFYDESMLKSQFALS